MPSKMTLRQIRRLNDLTIQDVSDKLSVSQPTWASWENGRTTIPADKFMNFCEWLEVDSNDIDLDKKED